MFTKIKVIETRWNCETLGEMDFPNGITVIPRKDEQIKIKGMCSSEIVKFVVLDYAENILKVYVH